MGFVRFTQGSGSPQFGYRVANRIVACTPPLETGPGGKPTRDGIPESERLSTRDGTAGSGRTSYPPSGLSVTAESLEDSTVFNVNDVGILVPADPATIVRLDGCYQHDVTDEGFNPLVEEAGFDGMDYPSLWVAPNSTLTPHEGTVRMPAHMRDVRPGVELGVIIDSHARALEPDEALDAVCGYTVCLDLAVHDDEPGLEGYRMFDTSLPCGPEIIGRDCIDPEALALGIRVNGEPVDVQSTTSFRFSLAELVSYVSEVLTLSPGDLLTTGTPIRGAPALEDGDDVEVWVESVGTLQATVEWEGAR